jgi:hypothetical protein
MLSIIAAVLLAPAAPVHSSRCEVTVVATDAPADADRVAVTVEFSNGPNRVVVPGFWDGGVTWKARARLAPGPWQYRVRSSPKVPGLDGAEGSVEAPGLPRNEFDRRGPIAVSKSGTHFVYGDGTPFFWLGDTCWNGPLLSSEADWTHYLTTRQRQRFTVIQFNVLAPWRAAPADAEGRTAFTRKERVEINPGFFRRLDARIDAINERGMLAAGAILWAISGPTNPGWILTDDQCVFVARYVVARYHAHDVAWFLAGDGAYGGKDAVARWTKVGRAVFGDRPANPVSLHPAGMDWPFEAYRGEPWLNFITYQSGHGDDGKTLAWTHSGPPSANWNRPPIKPVLNAEPPYEGHLGYQSRQPLSDYAVRRSVWWSLLATPVAGLTYGSHGVWSWQSTAGLPYDHDSTGVAPPWYQATDRPGARQLKLLRDFLDKLPWTEFRPAPQLLAVQPGEKVPERFIGVARAEPSGAVLAYLPVGGTIRFRPGALPPAATASWYDPRNGTTTPPAPAVAELTAPDVKDWVLVIRPVRP